MVIQAWYPLGHGDKALLEEPLFAELAKKYGKTNAQVILRWHIQAGNIVIPGSKNPAHIKDNFDLFDFSLTEEEMAKITRPGQEHPLLPQHPGDAAEIRGDGPRRGRPKVRRGEFVVKVLLINGSPRYGGNTAIALGEMEKIFQEEGIETETVQVGNKAIRGCVAVWPARKTGNASLTTWSTRPPPNSPPPTAW